LPALHQFISNNQAAMIDYHRFQQAGYYIGSAVVEKAVDLLVCRRQKLEGKTGVELEPVAFSAGDN